MKNDATDRKLGFGLALPTSFILHAAVLALLIFGLPKSFSEPQKEEAISVNLVPPPEEEKKEPPPQPAPEEAKKEEPPPPPPPPPPPEEKPEDPPKPPPQKEEEKAEPPPPAVINPVVQFGEKDAGPQNAADGDSPEEAASEPAQAQETSEPEPDPKPDAAQLQQLAAAAAEAAAAQAAPPPPDEKPKEPTTAIAIVKDPVKLDKATKLFSRTVSEDKRATTAMANLPRGVRAGRLCVTELREQLRNGLPPYYPELLPSHGLESGNVIDIENTAFRNAGRWMNLSYRCEVDADAMKVVSFAYGVGKPIPRDEWKSRGLPAQ